MKIRWGFGVGSITGAIVGISVMVFDGWLYWIIAIPVSVIGLFLYDYARKHEEEE